jgi:hypothetical protein
MMTKFISLFAILLLSSSVYGLDIGGITLPEQLESEHHQTLKLNGAGIREKWFVDLYVGGLYLGQPSDNAEAVLDSDTTMAIRLHIISDMITSAKMVKATLEGFENATHGNTAALEADIATFLATFEEPIQEGDVFDFIYIPSAGVNIYKNTLLAQTISGGTAFKKALFGIWLCDKPAQMSLKQGMLGRHR